MSERSLVQRWEEYRPAKAAVFWTFVTGIVLTLVVGFNWGGWVTGGTAREMSQTAAEDARAELVADVCVERFMNAADASAQLATLRETSSWQRDIFIADGGWATLVGMDKPVREAADLCAERLMDMKSLTAAKT
jgi:hypothetical protein